MNIEHARIEHARRMASLDSELSFLPSQQYELISSAERDYRSGKCSKVQCIKRIKNVMNWGLKDTKDYVEWRTPQPDVEYVPPPYGSMDTPDHATGGLRELSERVKLLEKQLEEKQSASDKLLTELCSERDAHSTTQCELEDERDKNSQLRDKVRAMADALRSLISIVD